MSDSTATALHEAYEQENTNLTELTPERFIPRPPITYGPRQTTPLMEARYIQRVIFSRACDPTTPAIALSHLARGWVALQTSIREMRGIPLPGQLRPDLPPMKGLKGKRGKGSPVLDLPAAQAFSEAVEKVKAEARAAGAQLDTEDTAAGEPIAESQPPEGNAKRSETRATPAPKPSTKPAPKPKE